MILLLDNYDSFTYNLAQYLGQWARNWKCVATTRSPSKKSARRPERIVISPGPCTPEEAGISVALIQRFAGKIPILGVCLGHQAIGEAFGGSVIRAPEIMHGKTSGIHHDSKTIFRDLPQDFLATRYHSLIVERKSLPATLEISAETATASSWACATASCASKACNSIPNRCSPTPAFKLLENFLSI